jgi:hydrogenase maturation protease
VNDLAPAVVVIGVGNELCGDDGAGLEVAARVAARVDPAEVAVRSVPGEALGLLEQLPGFRAAVLVDASHSGAPAGTTRRHDVSVKPLPLSLGSSTSTHAVGVGEALELARALGHLPDRVVLHAIEGERFDAGDDLSGPVRAALPALCEAVLGEAWALARRPPAHTLAPGSGSQAPPGDVCY